MIVTRLYRLGMVVLAMVVGSLTLHETCFASQDTGSAEGGNTLLFTLPTSASSSLSVFPVPLTYGNDAQPPRPLWNLETIVKHAFANSPQILGRQYQRDSSKLAVDSAYWQFFPSPYINVQQVANHDPDSGIYDRAITFGVQQPLWSGGRLTSGYDVAKSQLKSSEWYILEGGNSLALQIATAYQSYWQNRWRSAVQRTGNQRLEDFVSMIQRRSESGVSAVADLLLVESRLNQGVSDLSVSETAVKTAQTRLEQLVGVTFQHQDFEEIVNVPALPQFSAVQLEDAIMKHPALERQHADIELVENQSHLQKSALMPTLSVKVEHQSGFFSQDAVGNDTRMFIDLSYSPGSWMSAFKNYKSSQAKISGQKENYRAIKRELLSQITAEYNDCTSSYNRLQFYTKIVDQSIQVLESYKRMFIAGKRSWLDVLNAERELTQVELLMVDTKALFITSEFRLRLLSGQLPLASKAD